MKTRVLGALILGTDTRISWYQHEVPEHVPTYSVNINGTVYEYKKYQEARMDFTSYVMDTVGYR